MATAVFIVHTILATSLLVGVVAGLFSVGVIGNGHILGVDSFRVLMWSGAIAVLTSPIVVTFVYPLESSERTADDEGAGS